jgi:hypothetical protein
MKRSDARTKRLLEDGAQSWQLGSYVPLQERYRALATLHVCGTWLGDQRREYARQKAAEGGYRTRHPC